MRQAAKVTVYTLGGTIAMTSNNGRPVAPALSAADLLASVPGLEQQSVTLTTRDFRQVAGGSLTFGDIAELAESIRSDIAAGTDGVVITQGTDTIEESAYLLHLYHRPPQAVVVTGAMRHPSLASPDGPANLLAAVQVAANPNAHSRGCLVVMADQIHSARYVTKAHTTATNAFVSDRGPVGQLLEGVARFHHPVASRLVLNPPSSTTVVPQVGVVTATLGDTGEWITDYSQKLDGLVIAGFGVGHVPMSWAEIMEKVAASKPVVLASRISRGSTLTSTYGFVGSESDLLSRGVIGSGDLGTLRSRLLLQALLATGAPQHIIIDTFAKA